MKNVAVILAAGSGERFGTTIPKQFIKLNGIPMIIYPVEEFIKSGLFVKLIVVTNNLEYAYLFDKYGPTVEVINGGELRSESVYKALQHAKRYNPDNIVFHEAVRPLIKKEDLAIYIDLLSKYDCVATSEPITDALYGGDRGDFKLIQAPESFKFDKLYDEFDVTIPTTAIYEQLKEPNIYFNTLNHPNYKVTYFYDLFMLEHLIKFSAYRKQESNNLCDKHVLLLGSTGGIGGGVKGLLDKYPELIVYTPTRKELNLADYFIDYLTTKYQNVDTIINCAGSSYGDSDSLLSHYEEIMNTNFRANVLLLNYAKALRVIHNRPINIVLISSSSASRGRPGFGIYSASKSALHSLVESQASTLVESNIYLNCICPERVDTKMNAQIHGTAHKADILTIEEVSRVILNYVNTTEYGKIVYLRKGMRL
jgi:2-C-methyl-D-erythritol 4-phosphate cytidylyltransferase